MKNIHITRIILRGFKGFKTTNIAIADIKMVKKLQQLISTNGSGKSTFLSEFSLSPINKELFRKGGGKIVEFTVDGVNYIFRSNHKGHVLINADTKETLTQGETITHYNELVNTMFGYTDYKWKLVVGHLRFTELSKAERQKWIETISGIDFSYPFKIYAAIKNQITGIKRAIKEYDAELANSEDQILSEELRQAKTDRKTELSEIISHIIANKDSTPNGERIKAAVEKFTKLNDELYLAKQKVLYAETPCFGHLNVDSLDEFRESYLADTVELDNLDVAFSNKEKELREKVELRDKLNTKDEYDVAKGKSLLTNKRAELEELEDLTGSFIFSHPLEVLKHYAVNKEEILQQIQLDIVGKLGSIDSISHTVGSEVRRGIIKHNSELNSDLRLAQESLRHVDEMIRTTKAGKDITCPKCQEVFKDGYSDLKSLEERHEELERDINLLSIEANKTKESIDSFTAIDNAQRHICDIVDNHISIGEIRLEIRQNIEAGANLADIATRLEHNLEIARNSYRIYSLRKETRELSGTIEYYEGLAKLGSAADFQNKCDVLEQELVDIRDKRIALKATMEAKAKDGKALAKYIADLDNFEVLVEEHSVALKDLKHVLYSSTVGKMLEDMQVELGKISTDLTNDAITAGVRNKLGKLAGESREKLKILSDLEVAINPSTGLIAEQLTAYCRLFSGYTSRVLSQVWGYNMEVLEPIVHPTRGVNYRFPMTIKDDEVISDIACGSTSQKSIIDLAINIASRELLNANCQPLILDEVGGGFDTIHNISLGEFLYGLINESPSKNILVIHHDQTIRSSLGDCDTVVFDPTQVVVEEGYNEHVRLTH